MKKLIVFCSLFCFLTSSISAQNDAINRYFEEHVENEIFTSVYVSPKLIEIVSEIDLQALDDGEIADNEAAIIEEVLEQLKGLMLLKTDIDPMLHYKEILAKFSEQNANFDLLLSVRDKGNNVKIWTETTADNTIKELVLLVGGEDEMVMLSLTGNIDLEKISKLAGNIDIDGIEYLDNLDKTEQ
jgi:hypothetical protein